LKDRQINKTISGGPAGFSTIFENAAETKGKGFELEIFARPAEIFRVSGALAYTDAEFEDFVTVDPLDPRSVNSPPAPPGSPPAPPNTNFGGDCTAVIGDDIRSDPDLNPATPTCEINLAGNQVRNTPKWTWNLHGELDIPVLPETVGTLMLTGDATYRSKIFFTEFNRLIEGTESYTLFNGALIFKTPDERWSVAAWVKNLSNVFRPQSTFALATGRIIGATWVPPRTYGLTVGFRY
jgi:iron complex outermembrane receptor protein